MKRGVARKLEEEEGSVNISITSGVRAFLILLVPSGLVAAFASCVISAQREEKGNNNITNIITIGLPQKSSSFFQRFEAHCQGGLLSLCD